jgi:predicted lipid carrier protein YhbT
MHPLEKPMTEFLHRVPDNVKTKIFVRIFNHLLRGQDLANRLAELDNRTVTLRITDIPCAFNLHILNGRLRTSNSGTGDVTISGDLQGFLQLASLQEDPDTLFFQRVLRIDGETETGVHIKNILDALEYDWDAHFDAILSPPLARGAKRIMHTTRRYIPDNVRRRLGILNL